MALPPPQEFKLTDAQGVAHNYVIEIAPAGEGMSTAMTLMGLVSAPALNTLGRVLLPVIATSLQGAKISDMLDDPNLLGDVLANAQNAEWSSTGEAVGALLQSPRAHQFARDVLLKRVIRDKQSLNAPGVFDAAFSANYGELWSLLIEVIGRNGFFALPSSWQQALKEAADKAAQEKADREAAAATATEEAQEVTGA